MSSVEPSDLTPRQGKLLRYVITRNRHGQERIKADDCIVKIAWSDLPKNHNQSVNTLGALNKFGLVDKDNKGYFATAKGKKLMAAADKARMWNKPPPPSVTNQPSRRKR